MKKILIMMVLIGIMASAANAFDLTSVEAEKMALNHSYQLKIARSESEAYRSNLSAARAGRYPEFSLE
ncbi:MAG: TolC family protein, partial [bacterium]